MRVVNFMKIDYVLTKQQMRIMPLIALVGLLVGRGTGGREDGIGMLTACAYLFFISTGFATTPFGSCRRKDAGFLLMLPAAVAERVAGRFLYGLSFIGLTAVLSGVFAGVFYLMGYEITPMTVGLLLCMLAASILIVTFEYLLSYLFGEGKDNWQYLSNFVRIAPGMALFFGSIYVFGKMDEENYVMERMRFLTKGIVPKSLLAVVISLLIMAAAMAVCVKIIEKRDYA